MRKDISIAAFAAFISELENQLHISFALKPMDFIYISNLSSHINKFGVYLAGIIEELKKIETSWEPFGQSTVNGFHSLKDTNLFQTPSGKIDQLRSIIIDEIAAYFLKFQDERCTYIEKFPTTRDLYAWTIILKRQGHQNAHIHPSGWLSGVIYLKVVPSLGKDEGAIEFSLNGENYSDLNSPKLVHQPEEI